MTAKADAPKMTAEHIEALKFAGAALDDRATRLFDTGLHGAAQCWRDRHARLAEVAAFLRGHTDEQA